MMIGPWAQMDWTTAVKTEVTQLCSYPFALPSSEWENLALTIVVQQWDHQHLVISEE